MTRLARARRRLDRAFYRLLGAVYRRIFPTDAPRGRVPRAAVRRALVVRHDAIGDMAVTLPAIAYLHATLPGVEVDVVASPRNAGLLAGDPRVRRVYVNDHSLGTWLRLSRELRARGYDVVVSTLLRNGLREGLFAAVVAGRRAARVTPWRQAQYLGLFTHPVRVPRSERHMATRLLAVVQRAIGDGPAPARTDLAAYPAELAHDAEADARAAAFLDAHVGGPFVALNAWAAEAPRVLGRSLAAEIAVGLATRLAPLAVVVTPPPSAVPEAEAIAADARAAGAARVLVAPAGALADLVALLRRASLVVTPDTANVHLASALGVPVVSLHTALGGDVGEWGPWGVPNRTVVLRDPRPLRDAPASDVLAAVDDLVRAIEGGR